MRLLIVSICISIILIFELSAQIFSLGVGFTYTKSFKETAVYEKTYSGFIGYSGLVYMRPFDQIPIRFALNLTYGNKNLVSSSVPAQPNSFVVSRDIILILTSFEIFYQVYHFDVLFFFLGGKIGLNNTIVDEHFMGEDFSNSGSSFIGGISSEIEVKLFQSVSLAGDISYNFNNNKVINLRDYDFSGFWFDLKILYNL